MHGMPAGAQAQLHQELSVVHHQKVHAMSVTTHEPSPPPVLTVLDVMSVVHEALKPPSHEEVHMGC